MVHQRRARAGPARLLLTLLLTQCGQVDHGFVLPVPGIICPGFGVRVARRDSPDVLYAGADPRDAAVCLTASEDGQEGRFIAGLITQPAADEASLRQGLANLFPLAPGRRTSFIWRTPIAGSSGDVGTFQETWRVAGERGLWIDGTERRVWILDRDQRNVSGNESRFAYRYEIRYTIDRTTGAPLSFSGRSMTRNGRAMPVPAWIATSILVPGAAEADGIRRE